MGFLFHFHCGFIHICDTIFGKKKQKTKNKTKKNKIRGNSRDFGFVHGGLKLMMLRRRRRLIMMMMTTIIIIIKSLVARCRDDFGCDV